MKSSLRRVLNSPPRNLTKSPKSTPASPVELPSSAATHSGSGTAIPNHLLPLEYPTFPPASPTIESHSVELAASQTAEPPRNPIQKSSPLPRLIHRSPKHSPPAHRVDLFSPSTLLGPAIQLSSPLHSKPNVQSFSTSPFRPAGPTVAPETIVKQEEEPESVKEEVVEPVFSSSQGSKFRPAGSTLANKAAERQVKMEVKQEMIEGEYGPPPPSFDIEAYADRMAARQSDSDPAEPPKPIVKKESMNDGESSDIEMVITKKPAARKKPPTFRRSESRSASPKPIIAVLADATTSEPSSATPAAAGWFAKPASLVAAEANPAGDWSNEPLTPLEAALFSGTAGTKQDRELAKGLKESLLAKLPPFDSTHYPTPPTIIYSTKEVEIKKVLEGMKGPLAFDLEWPVSNRRGVEFPTALAQVCDESTILLVHVAKMAKKTLSPSLKALLENPEITKLGVMISGDGKKIERDFGVKCQGLFELNDSVKNFDGARWKARSRIVGLQDLVGFYLQRYLTKDPKIRCGGWDTALSLTQRAYAANDVYSTLKVHQTLQMIARTQPPPPPPPARAPLAPTTAPTAATAPAPAAKPRSTKSTPRQLEAFQLFTKGHPTAKVSEIMSLTRKIAPISAVWNLLGYLNIERQVEFDDEELLCIVEGVQGGSKSRMMAEFAEFVEEVERRVSTS